MTAPSDLHESRRRSLADLATLAGFTATAELPDGLIPDVCRRSGSGQLLCADAKATEGSGCAQTLHRLVRYARRCLPETCPSVLVVGHDLDQAWADTLHQAVARAGGVVLGHGRTELEDMAVTHVVLRRA